MRLLVKYFYVLAHRILSLKCSVTLWTPLFSDKNALPIRKEAVWKDKLVWFSVPSGPRRETGPVLGFL